MQKNQVAIKALPETVLVPCKRRQIKQKKQTWQQSKQPWDFCLPLVLYSKYSSSFVCVFVFLLLFVLNPAWFLTLTMQKAFLLSLSAGKVCAFPFLNWKSLIFPLMALQNAALLVFGVSRKTASLLFSMNGFATSVHERMTYGHVRKNSAWKFQKQWADTQWAACPWKAKGCKRPCCFRRAVEHRISWVLLGSGGSTSKSTGCFWISHCVN